MSLFKKSFYQMLLVCTMTLGFLGCEEEEAGEATQKSGKFDAEVLEVSCGGVVLQFLDVEVGESWRNAFGDGELYDHVVKTGNISEARVEEGDILQLDFEEVEFLEGFYCDIGGLPSASVKVWNVEIMN